MNLILDAHALMIYLEQEPGYKMVQDLFTAAAAKKSRLYMTTVNWGEVFYIVGRELGAARADEIAKLIETFPIDLVSVDRELAKAAALIKAEHKMSYADCFAAALAHLRKGEVITADKEFKSVEREIKIRWIDV